ncbi:hypothetical protein SPBR_02950 [Sporothrix brasiliensis 5110]|uniref:Thioesterase thiol ester dehydrase-isomerase n=1 Tax=Sporothrix brasiliensis 5110 TaxID=1398154 RepID=A0A0C2EZN3_9PEZI|nr:uncharacterized protein SPBR_02950 [Sporothrix brasiliensis 5110]KIH91999.1 hypothetical protein SPBR_02950 [Sporothrix brasiliensis 5110]
MTFLRLQSFQAAARWTDCYGAGWMARPVTRIQKYRSGLHLHHATARTYSIVGLAGGAMTTRTFSSLQLGPGSGLEPSPLPPARWLADLRHRVGKCIMFGCSTAQVSEAAMVARALATEWRRLIAGSEGYLTGERRGLEGQKVVWGEMDSFAHVNNVVYARYAESSRVNWVNHIALHVDAAHSDQWQGLMQAQTVGLIMKSLTTEFKFPMTFPDAISVYHRLRVSPEANSKSTSLLLDCLVLSHSHKRIAARVYEDVSFYDYRTASKTQMPEFMREVLTDLWQQQLHEATLARIRIWELVAAVERLEKQTWDREEAVEDIGSVGT